MTPGFTQDTRRRIPRTRASLRLLRFLPAAFAACDAAPGPTLTTRSDSAGIPVVTAVAPMWGPGEGWTVSAGPLVKIGAVDGPREQLLDGVAGAVRLSSGDIVLGEWTTGELRRYDPEGTLVWRAAGQGEGPGEHRMLAFAGLIPDDTVVTWDRRLNRVQLFDPDGGPVRAFRVEAPGSGAPPTGVIGVSGRHLVLTFNAGGAEPEDGIVRWPAVRIATLSLEDGSVRVVMDAPGPEVRADVDGALVRVMEYPFGKGPRYSVSAGRLAIVDTERFSVRSVSLDDGAVTAILRRDEPVREVTDEDVDADVEWMTSVSATAGLHVPPGLREQPMAPTLPALKSIHLDAGGNLWVEPHSRRGSQVPPFRVYTPDGRWLGTVGVPPGLQQENLGLTVRLEIGEDYILGVWRDELEVEYVRMYGLVK